MRTLSLFVAIGLTLVLLHGPDTGAATPAAATSWSSRGKPGDELGIGKSLGPAGIVQVRELSRTPGDHPHAFTATIFTLAPGGFEARVIDQPIAESATAPTLKDTRVREKAFLVINGGYFDAAFQPDGWCRAGGKEIRGASELPVYSGLVVCEKGKGFDLRRYHHLKDMPPVIPAGADLLQAGPFIIDPGGARGIRREAGPSVPRTVLALAKTKTGRAWVVLITTPVTLYDLAEALAEPAAWGMEIERALNLDGGPSTGFSMQAGEVTREQPAVTPVRNHLAFVARAP